MATPVSFEADLENAVTAHAFELSKPVPHRGLRRAITLEQGHALETISHAIDYLNDCYLNEGQGEQILDFRGPDMDAVRILISGQHRLLSSLPLKEPLGVRLRKALLRHKPAAKPVPVVPLSSSR